MKKILFGYRDNMRVEVETGIAVTAKTVADLRSLPAWPDGLALNIHVDLDPRFSVVRVERALLIQPCQSAAFRRLGLSKTSAAVLSSRPATTDR
jgi:hypothetical protein